ncbi:MAG: DNA mismatch repair protein [Lachnospiraceae bacterium]|nr:DNA mismatch repair protein [Lachnospiraceae bacterium]
MAKKRPISLLYPVDDESTYRILSDTTCHDLGLDTLCEQLSQKPNERNMLLSVLKTMTASPGVASYRARIFEDVRRLPDMCARLQELLSQVQFLNDYGSFRKDHDIKAGLWEFLHRLSELNDYIKSVEGIRDCLAGSDIQSDGLLSLKDYIETVFIDSHFEELKKDIAGLNADTQNLKSVTVGINLNPSFQVKSVGVISVNSKEFKNSGILGNFADAVAASDPIKQDNEWKGDMHYRQVTKTTSEFLPAMEKLGGFAASLQIPLLGAQMAATVANVPENDTGAYMTHYLDKEVSQLLSHLTKKLERILSKYVNFSIHTIVDLIPEFYYYVTFAKYLDKFREKGYTFCMPEAVEETDGVKMKAGGIYNLKLAISGEVSPADMVPNDLIFDTDHTIYLLTGANRGGKTTITQAVGLCYVLAQGGISVPGSSFRYVPVDSIYTHYPADEDKTMDLGRLGEECSRFKEIYSACTGNSLLLLNETFSTTSFEEGYYIASDAVKALLQKNVRTIYNTHMHKLAFEVEELNAFANKGKAASLVARTSDGKRSFTIVLSEPEGRSHAGDIAEKYGVTYEMLTKDRGPETTGP